jgi:hypothetical protein
MGALVCAACFVADEAGAAPVASLVVGSAEVVSGILIDAAGRRAIGGS